MTNTKYLTASKLYNYLQCNHRVWRDTYGPQEERIEETNPFVQLLWDKGVQHEKEVVERFGQMVDLGDGDQKTRIARTKQALADKVELLYQPVIAHENLLGIPDFLRRQEDGSYIAVDVKSGRGFEGTAENDDEEDPKPKKHYAVQLALYTEILEHMGLSNGKRQAIIHDIDHQEILYDLNAPMGKRTPQTYWEFYQWLKVEVLRLLSNEKKNDPALAGICKLCPWYSSCKQWVMQTDDTTGLFYVGRSARDTLRDDIDLATIKDASTIDISALLDEKKAKGKHFLNGIAQNTLEKIKRRAEIMTKTKRPVLYQPVELPSVNYELFFDIEDDPTQAFIYLHGVYERGPAGKRFISFTAEELNEKAEAKAWADFWLYIRSLPENDFVVYYYSHHEKTTYKRMSKKYPEVASAEDIEWFFDKSRAIDLYSDVILKHTDWPVGSYSLKAIAQFLGFRWRDETPSGALSIQWYNEYLKTDDKKILDRILLYNEDDCIATMVIKDELVKMNSELFPT